MINIIREIKWAWQRVVKGYDDRVFWDFSDYFMAVMPALRIFCEEELRKEESRLNPERTEIFKKTMELIDACQPAEGFFDFDEEQKAEDELLKYVGLHASWYWD